ncbi:MAG TPA: hypothetical protein VN176_13045 [Verrucomicrobiae bacterium]|jgi:hypothetical protein|nr:hypothetical protein [Verrucomicrobiae bacterium]
MSHGNIHLRYLFAAFLLTALPVLAQSNARAQASSVQTDGLSSGLRPPVEVQYQFLPSHGVGQRFETGAKTSVSARTAIQQGRVHSVPVFSSTLTFDGRPFPLTLVGKAPKEGGTTEVKTQVIPVSMFFEGFADVGGNPIVLDVNTVLPLALNSPNFRAASYPSGFTQFADAAQRAQFFHSMDPNWHTMLTPPQMLKPVVIDVPRGAASLYRVPSGRVFAIVDTGFFVSQLNTIIQTEDLDVEALPIALTTDVFLSPGASISGCCVLGFHTAFDGGQRENTVLLQTFIWASWIDDGIFGGTLADVTPLSHEISEWMNNPFGSNVVPPWAFPNGAGGCQDNLETGDPVAVFANSGFPVTIDGFTYHPQSQALLQWFARNQMSEAMEGAFSFPDGTLLPTPSQPCTPR